MAAKHLKVPVLLAILAGLSTFALKMAAWQFTGSVGLFSDAVESLVNLLAAVTAYLSLVYAARPVDASHTYGHEKIEFFSSGMEGVLIFVAALGIAYYALVRLVAPQPPEASSIGMALAFVSAVINGAAAQVLLRVGRRHGSIVLEADGKHLMTDVWTTLAILAGLGVVWLTGVPALDPLIALAVAASILWTAGDLIRRSFNGLMDHALPEEELARVRSAIAANLGTGMDFHALRTRQAGARRFVDFHLLVPGKMTVREAHELTGRVERSVEASLPGLEVTVHIEPIEDRAAYEDSALVPLEEAARRERREHKEDSAGGAH